MEKGAVFPLFYHPPVEYFAKMLKYKDNVFVENAEHFQKQSYRNRATIHSANGPLDLIVPINRGSINHTSIKDVRISYEFNWQRIHWLSLQASYRSSAYFEYYEDDFSIFYEKKWNFLFDYNEELLHLILKILKQKVSFTYTNHFEKDYLDVQDYRNSIHPKHRAIASTNPYFQVFEERNGFLPNLSFIDLLFNQGPQSIQYL